MCTRRHDKDAALLVISKKRGGAGNPNTDHYIYHMNKEWYIHMMEYYTVMKIEIICIYPEKEKGGAREGE